MLKKIISKFAQLIHTPDVFMQYNNKYKDYEIGEWTYGDPKIILGRTHGKIRIGKYCSISSNVEFVLAGDHRMNFVTTYPFNVLFDEFKNLMGHPRHRGDIIIGNDVWIGYGAKILSGTTIGDGAVIGFNSVVTKDVPPYAIVVGNPSKIIRYRFSPELIEKLLLIKWWDWTHEKVLNAVPLLANDNISKFIEFAMKNDDK